MCLFQIHVKNSKIQPEKVIWRKLLLYSPHKIQLWFAIHLQIMRKIFLDHKSIFGSFKTKFARNDSKHYIFYKNSFSFSPKTSQSLYPTLIKKKIKFSSYIRKFRVEQLQSHIWLTASSYMEKYLRISSYKTLQLLHYEFPYIWRKFDLFHQCNLYLSNSMS